MKDKPDMIAQGDLIAFIVFTRALLLKKGRADISRTRYVAMFAVFQFLLGQKVSGQHKDGTRTIAEIKLFDFDSYNRVYARLKGEKLPD